jgi:hypothetical protein
MTQPAGPEPRTASPILALVAAARVGVGATMLLAPGRFFKPESGTETLLMQTIGIRDVVIGSGALAALVGRGDGGFRRWAAAGLASDSADLLLGLRSKRLVGAKSALIATLAPVPFVGGGLYGLAGRFRRAP